MKTISSLVLAVGFASILGCGSSSSDQQAPSGSELQQYLAEHPELNDVVEPDDNADK